LRHRSPRPLAPQSSKSRFRWRNALKQLTHNTASKKRAQEDEDSDYLFADAQRQARSGENNDLSTGFVFFHQAMSQHDIIQMKGLCYLNTKPACLDLPGRRPTVPQPFSFGPRESVREQTYELFGRSFRRYSAFLGGSLRKAPARKSRAMTMG
jgi:hypothetical protein